MVKNFKLPLFILALFAIAAAGAVWLNYGEENFKKEENKKCFDTVQTFGLYNHTHRWCESDENTDEFCAANVSCHKHKINEELNETDVTGEGDQVHSHMLRYRYINAVANAIQNLMDQNDDEVVIDVSDKWSDGHLPEAINYPYADGTFVSKISEWEKNHPYIIYGRNDEESIAAAEVLIDSGFREVFRLLGNFTAWEEGNYKIEK